MLAADLTLFCSSILPLLKWIVTYVEYSSCYFLFAKVCLYVYVNGLVWYSHISEFCLSTWLK